MTLSSSGPMPDINRFFMEVFRSVPEFRSHDKGTEYSIPGKGIKVVTDNYRGCHIEVGKLSEFDLILAKSAIEKLTMYIKLKDSFNSIWINISREKYQNTLGALLPDSFQIGVDGKCDIIRDTQQNKIRIWKWLNSQKECTIPPGATHNIGATALIIDREAQKVLLVVNKGRDKEWNLPGGNFDLGKDKSTRDTALREAEEEGGFVIDRKTLSEPLSVGYMEFPKNQFSPAINFVWAYFIDGISEKQLNPPPNEINQAQWVNFSEVESSSGNYQDCTISAEIKAVFKAAINHLGFNATSAKEWKIVYAPRVENNLAQQLVRIMQSAVDEAAKRLSLKFPGQSIDKNSIEFVSLNQLEFSDSSRLSGTLLADKAYRVSFKYNATAYHLDTTDGSFFESRALNLVRYPSLLLEKICDKISELKRQQVTPDKIEITSCLKRKGYKFSYEECNRDLTEWMSQKEETHYAFSIKFENETFSFYFNEEGETRQIESGI